jgi:hypothetical protein
VKEQGIGWTGCLKKITLKHSPGNRNHKNSFNKIKGTWPKTGQPEEI